MKLVRELVRQGAGDAACFLRQTHARNGIGTNSSVRYDDKE